MRREHVALESLAARDNLLLAVARAARGKHARPPVARYLAHMEQHLTQLAADILSNRAPQGRARQFIIHDPKRRTIIAACFADRVLHHAIINVSGERFERLLVPTSFACRPGKGVHAAVRYAQSQLQRWPWCVHVDIANYFGSIDHSTLNGLLARLFKGPGFLALLSRIIAAGDVGATGQGLPIGALTSQYFANAYLAGADRALQAMPGVCAAMRYMDDILWWSPSRHAAQATLAALRDVLWQTCRLRIKDGVHLGRSQQGLKYCGFRVKPGVVLASSRKLTRYRRTCQHLARVWHTGQTSEVLLQRAYDARLATLQGAQTLGFRHRLHAEQDARVDRGYPRTPGDDAV